MSPGPDGDDDELVDIELELDGPPPSPVDATRRKPPTAPPPAPAGAVSDVEIPDIIEVRQPIVEAADVDGKADAALYEAEATASDEPGRRATLLLDVAALAGAGDDTSEAALEAVRRAFAAAPGLGAALWMLRERLARAWKWSELADAYAAAAAVTAADTDRADLLVERGRLLEDRLGEDRGAMASYHDALAASSDHVGALLALLLAGARLDDSEAVAGALDGLARRAGDGTRRTALAIEAAAARRQSGDPQTSALALAQLEAELSRGDESSPVGTLLAEIETLTGPDVPPEIASRALAEIARRAAAHDTAFSVGLFRERARLLARAGDARGARAALDDAAGLDPAHPLVAAERLELAAASGEADTVDAIARELVDAARSDDEAVDFALLHAGIALRAGREAAASSSLEAPRVRARRPARGDLRAFELALTIRRHDRAGLANVFLAEAGRLAGQDGQQDGHGAGHGNVDGPGQANALAAAGALWQWSLGDPSVAEGMYRRALELEPAHVASLHALLALLGADRAAEAAALLEAALESEASGPHEAWIRTMLVTIFADELGEAARALPHQRRLAALAPNDVDRLVRLHDLELGGTLGIGGLEVETLLALAARAGDATVATALRVAAGRGLVESDDPEAIERGMALLKEVSPLDATGLAASAREARAPSREMRIEVTEGELVHGGARVPVEIRRALRFRLAYHHVQAGRHAEAVAALTPLRYEGDPLARAWSHQLARQSGDAILEVAVLSDETESADGVLGVEAGVRLAHGEALARAGDPGGAVEVLRRALVAAAGEAIAADSALAMLRLVALDRRPGPDAIPEALRALAAACADDPEVHAAAMREEALARVAAGVSGPADLDLAVEPDAPLRARADAAVVRFVAGVGLGEPRATADALVDMAAQSAELGRASAEVVSLLARAVTRARLAGPEVADAVAQRAWQVAHAPVVSQALSDLPAAPGGTWPPGRPDTRRARAGRAGGTMGIALELEVALDAERRGALGTALAAYGSVITIDPDRLEAWTGIRRVARAGGDVLGEGRALARLGALVRDTARASTFLVEAAEVYQRADRTDDALTCLAKAVELAPGDSDAYRRMTEILLSDLAVPGYADLFDNLISHRLVAVAMGSTERVAMLHQRAEHRRRYLHDRVAAFEDLKHILTILPEHREALHELATGAIEDRDGAAAAHWLERFLAAFGDDPRAPQARLDLAVAYELGKEKTRAVDTLRRAAGLRANDPEPLQRLADLQLRAGDWRSGIEALRACEPRLPDPHARAEIHLRIGAVLRDLGRDPAGAAASFRRAAELDPMGNGTLAVVALHDSVGDVPGALETARHEVARLRGALAPDPLKQPLLERLLEFLAIARKHGAPAPITEAEAAVSSVIDLVTSPRLAPGSAQLPFAPRSVAQLWTELVDPAATGFVAEVWPHLTEAASAIHPTASPRDRRATAAAGQSAYAWITTAATALGLGALEIYLGREDNAPPVVALEEATPALLIAPGAEKVPGFRFHVGRSLALLAQHAAVLERTSADELAPLFACAAVLAGAPSPPGLPAPSEESLRAVTKALGRKHRKALALQASRFGFEVFDLGVWRRAVLASADRLGLVFEGDVARAAMALGGGAVAAVATHAAALEMIRYALGERYPALRRAAAGGT